MTSTAVGTQQTWRACIICIVWYVSTHPLWSRFEGTDIVAIQNLLRQSLYFNIDYYRSKGTGAFVNDDHIVQKHVSHCMDIIRQQLMCTVDIGVLGQVWWQPQDQPMPEPFVDFNTKHVCRNYDDIRRWAEEHQLPEDVPDDYLAPPIPGARILDHVP